MAEPLRDLARESYINLETFKRDGSGVKTPIWFAIEGDGLVFMTDGRSYKCKRLRRNDKVRFAACGMAGAIKGPWFDGTCRPIDDPAERKRAIAALASHYPFAWRLGTVMSTIGRRVGHRAYYRITPS
jgi:PPOX class probable F420-dependent enzyme